MFYFSFHSVSRQHDVLFNTFARSSGTFHKGAAEPSFIRTSMVARSPSRECRPTISPARRWLRWCGDAIRSDGREVRPFLLAPLDDVTEVHVPAPKPHQAAICACIWWTTWDLDEFAITASVDGTVAFTHLQYPGRAISPCRLKVYLYITTEQRTLPL